MTDHFARTIRRVVHELQALILSGLLILLPLVLTGTAVHLFVRVISDWVAPIRFYEPAALQAVRFSEYGVLIAVVLGVGLFARLFLFRYLLDAIEGAIKRLPLVRHVYFGVKQLAAMLTSTGEKAAHHRPVLIEFPRMGMYSVGFVTGIVGRAWAPTPDEEWLSVFVPTTPNPTTGFYLMVPRRECKPLELTRNEAMALIISGGVLQPEGAP
jgi:uncharacterized membrane protein